MSTVINTNVAALGAQRALAKTSNELSTALQRLSSGMRINSAKDDAAGLAIAERLTSQVRGYNQAIRNAGDGISLSQTAEGGIEAITNALQRIRELAVQSANYTNTNADRTAITAEVNQLKAEINRVAEQTSFNGTPLLNGSFSGGGGGGEVGTARALRSSSPVPPHPYPTHPPPEPTSSFTRAPWRAPPAHAPRRRRRRRCRTTAHSRPPSTSPPWTWSGTRR